MVRTQIIATLGPASSREAVLRKMISNGLDAVRLNFSHGTHAGHLANIRAVRSLNRTMGRAVKIMQDLEGYRIRVGKVPEPIPLKKGQVFFLTQENVPGGPEQVSFDYEGALKAIPTGTLIYIDDGRIQMKVAGREKRRLKVRCLNAGILKEHKGINMLGVKLDFEGLTAKDRRDVKIALAQKLEFVAQSFVRNAADLKLLKDIVKPACPDCRIFAKVENQEALANLDEIIDESDGVIVARGDLGICVPIYKVPVIQKEIIKRCLLKKKPVVVATQMLESMTEAGLPTRAEASDVANAVLDGATHLLLSGETAVGKNPPNVIAMMNRIVKHTEDYQEKMRSVLAG